MSDSRTIQQKFLLIPRIWIWSSLVISLLVTVTSLLGIFYDQTYSRETAAWAIQAKGQDCANVVVVVMLLVTTYSVARHSVRGYLVWLSAHIYLIYAFAIYAFALHFHFLFLAYVAILGMSFYTLVGGIVALDSRQLAAVMPQGGIVKVASAWLMVIGVMFILLWLSTVIPNLIAGTVPEDLVQTQLWSNPVHVLDLAIMLPAMIITSVMLWRKRAMGYLMAVPLLIFAVTMGLGIVAMIILAATKGLPYSVAPAVSTGIIMIVSVALAYVFLRKTAGAGLS